MKKRFFLVSLLTALLASTGCEAWLHHHGYYPTAAAPAAYTPPQYCVPCVPYQPTAAPAAYPPVAAPSWNTPVASTPAAGTCCCPAPAR